MSLRACSNFHKLSGGVKDGVAFELGMACEGLLSFVLNVVFLRSLGGATSSTVIHTCACLAVTHTCACLAVTYTCVCLALTYTCVCNTHASTPAIVCTAGGPMHLNYRCRQRPCTHAVQHSPKAMQPLHHKQRCSHGNGTAHTKKLAGPL